MNVHAYAKHRNTTDHHVTEAIKSGSLYKSVTLNKRGLPEIDPEVADREWSPARISGKRSKGNGSSDSHQLDRRQKRDWNAEFSNTSLLGESKAKKAAAEAELVMIRLEKERNSVIAVDRVKDQIFKLTRMTRDRLMLIPDRISSEIAHEDNPAKIHHILSREITNSLIELCKELEFKKT